MKLDSMLADWSAFWDVHGYQVVLGALVVVVLGLLVAVVRAYRRGRPDKFVANIAGFAVLALSAEGMWVVARQRLGLPVVLAGAVFFVAEAAMVSSAMQASRQYERTTVRDDSGAIVRPGNPGKHGRAVWVIASIAGAIVALNSKSLVEFPLRLVLPLAAAYLWWNALTADGTSEGERSSWRWTPRRLLLAIGAIEPGERDMAEINRERTTAAMTVTAHRLHAGGLLVRWHGARLRRLARDADDEMIGEVRRRVDRVQRIAVLTAPGTEAARSVELTAAKEAHEQEIAGLRGELTAVRNAHEQEIAGLRGELTAVRESAAATEQTSESTVKALRGELERVKEAVAVRERELALLRSSAVSTGSAGPRPDTAGRSLGASNGATSNGAARSGVVGSPTPAFRAPVLPTPEPARSSAAPAPARPVEPGPGPEASLKTRVYALLDERPPVSAVPTKDVAEQIAERVDCPADTAARYVRAWRAERGPVASGPRLRVVTPDRERGRP